MLELKKIQNIPCSNCIHKNVCNIKKCFEETKIETTHPFVMIEVKCTEYISASTFENNMRPL